MKRLFLLFLFSSIGVLTTFAQHTKKNGTKLKTPVVQSIPAPSVSTGKSGAAQKKARRTKTETPAPAVKGQRQTSAKGQPQPLVKGRQPQVKGHQPPQGKMQQNVRGKASARNARTGRKGAKAPAYVTTEEIKGLQKQNQQLQKEISEHEEEVKIKQKDVDSRLQKIVRLDTEIGQHQRTIDNIATDIKGLDTNIGILKGQLSSLEAQLGERRARFIRSMRYMARHRSIQDKLMFVFSAKSLTQMYRRLRFVREYAAYQRAQGEQLKAKQQQVDQKHTQLKQVRGNKSNLLYKDRQVHAQMERKRVEQQTVVASLQNDQKVLQGVIAQRRQQQQALNAQIDRLIQIEIQKARARAIAEAKAQAAARAAAARKRAEEL
ncbi:MAG: murein hydrolase activator EnvC family protein, partial [Prevotella denticola]